MSKVLLIDGNSLMFRSYYATAYTGKLMQNKQGLYTNAIFGFCNMINKLIDDKDVSRIFVAFDAGKETFRHLSYDEYKGGRKPMPIEFKVQIPYIKKYLDLMNINHYECSEYEADDLVGSYAVKCNNEINEDIYVISGDKDLLQLAKGKVTVALTKKGITELDYYTEDNFKEKMGFESYQIPDYKGLVGDSSDNLPGIKGIGEKTALKLLDEYNTLDNIISNVNNLKGKVQSSIIENKDIGLKCKYLATLKTDIDLPYTLEELSIKKPNYNDLKTFYKELDFLSFIKKIDKMIIVEDRVCQNKDDEQTNNDICDIATTDYDFSVLKESYIVSESFKENYYDDSILGLGIYSINKNVKVFVPSSIIKSSDSLKKYLESDYPKKTYDLKKIYVSLKRLGITLKNVQYDAALAIYLINPNYIGNDFKQTIEHFIDSDIKYDESVYGYKSKATVPSIEEMAQNAIKKCIALKDSEEIILDHIKQFNQQQLLEIEHKLSFVLGDMEIDGLKIDKNVLNQIKEDLLVKQTEIEEKIYDIAGGKFNINSVKQLGEILFEKLSLPTGKKNKNGYSTSIEVLEKLAPNYKIAQYVLDYRAVNKIITTYIIGLDEVSNEEGFVHPLYKQTLTTTGRLSSVNPNIQNMPVRSEMGQVIRKAFVSRYMNGLILSCDYSQIELRVLAHMAQDEEMINSFNSSQDFHTNTAKWLYDVKDSALVTKEMRRTAKAINFGIVYGMSAWGLSESIKITPTEASMYIAKYFKTHYKVREFLDKVVREAKEKGYTKTIYNRVRYINEINSSNHNLASFGERTAMNAPIQGSAADIIKIAMVEVSRKIKNMKSKMIAQVHDELLFDVYPGELDELTKIVKETMEGVVSLDVPLIAEAESGNNWLEA